MKHPQRDYASIFILIVFALIISAYLAMKGYDMLSSGNEIECSVGTVGSFGCYTEFGWMFTCGGIVAAILIGLAVGKWNGY